MSSSCIDASRAEAQVPPGSGPDQRIAGMVSAYHKQVWRALRRLGVSDFDADDACQQVFIVAHRRVADIIPGTEQSFLLQTALRVASDYRRSRRRRPETDDGQIPFLADTAANPEEAADRRKARAMLDRALETMPIDLRQVFVLFDLEELTTAEVASVLNVPKGTVASRLRRAREVFHEIVSRLAAPRSGGFRAGGES